MAGSASPGLRNGAKEVRTGLWRRRSALAVVLIGSAPIAIGCGSSRHSPTSTAAATGTATTSTVSAGTISGHDLKSLPKAAAATRAAPSPPAGATKVDRSFLETTFEDIQRFWHRQFGAARLRYRPARLVIFSARVNSGCGAQEDVGPFYCPR